MNKLVVDGAGHPDILSQLRGTVLKENPNKVFASWYDGKGNFETERTFGQLWNHAGVVSHHLKHTWKVEKGELVVLCYDFGLHFFEVFLGCLRAGVVPVLVYPPAPPLKKSLTKLAAVVEDCSPKAVLIDKRVNALRLLDRSNPLSSTKALWPSVPFHVTDKLKYGDVEPYDESIAPEDLAFIQYTSGSTGQPKGVMVTHKALKANTELNHDGWEKYFSKGPGIGKLKEGELPTWFSWLPQYHDLGLIHACISPFVAGWRLHMMSPLSFIRNPLLWLHLMSKHKVTLGVGPDFAFRLCVRKYKEAQQHGREPLPGLDLSCLSGIQSGAEPIHLDSKRLFLECFRKNGLREDFFHGVYGLAENVVGVSWSNGYHVSTREEDMNPLVAVGDRRMFLPSARAKIVDPQTFKEVDDGTTGELWLSGPSAAAGYYGRPELSNEVFRAMLQVDGQEEASHDAYLRTGDLAFFENDRLFICGRIKDMIIIGGANIYPQDIEHTVQTASDAVRPGCVAAFASELCDAQVDVVCEIRHGMEATAEEVCGRIRSSVQETSGIDICRLVLVTEKSIPKTTSGKIQRRASREALRKDSLTVVYMDQRGNVDQQGKVSTKLSRQVSFKVDLADPEKPRSAESALREILGRFFSGIYDPDLSWEELGLSSMASIDLCHAIGEKFPVTVNPEMLQKYTTPRELEAFIQEHEGERINMKTRGLRRIRSMEMTWNTLGVIQSFGVLLMLFLVSSSAVLSWKLSTRIAEIEIITEQFQVGNHWHQWAWLPILIPALFLSFSVFVVAAKWIVIGRYQEGGCKTPSLYYARWWFVDRLLDVWEFFIGTYIKDTPLLVFFYRLLGAKLDSSVNLKAFIREPDLVGIGRNTTVSYDVRCRRFALWQDNEEGPSMRFRRITIGENCTIDGLVSLGSTVYKEVTVKKMAVVAECSAVRSGVLVLGNPAFQKRKQPSNHNTPANCWWAIGILKIVWLLLELYFFMAMLLSSQILVMEFLPTDAQWFFWCFWCFSVAIMFITAPLTSIPLKWLLIGKRKPGVYSDTTLRLVADWAADYHFGVVIRPLMAVHVYSLFWTVYLKLHGLDADYSSNIAFAHVFPPSKVDLVTVRRSFLGDEEISVKCSETRRYLPVSISNSSLGRKCALQPGSAVSNCIVQPLRAVEGKISGDVSHLDERTSDMREATICVWMEEFLGVLFAAALATLLGLTLLPAYEIWLAVNPTHVATEIATLVVIFLSVTLLWLSVYYLLFLIHDPWRRRYGEYPSYQMYKSYRQFGVTVQTWSFVRLLWGTPLYKYVAQWVLGSKVEGRFLYFGRHCIDSPFLTFRDRTVVDNSVVNGTHVIYGTLFMGEVDISGVLHDFCYAMANSASERAEHGPLRVLATGTLEAKRESETKDFSDEMLDVERPVDRDDDKWETKSIGSGDDMSEFFSCHLHMEFDQEE
ncbi:Putative fatty-acid--CoA ligase FadD21 [Seminavis robusta]|uniref:Fatty-acid--CoA ligase FadD21 n=1 Tax=Seminavis robusta TaxID=568900 RepID=A0A9N8HR62_9STRA|nr:Putative fatty-acid--CoA ligase FadD21 [Seminavis robusta]|eukprot:Sro1530_g280100.1 Putative fatty-acid--CoA ligase FadD21 (1436) ;mRNA; f:15150-19841